MERAAQMNRGGRETGPIALPVTPVYNAPTPTGTEPMRITIANVNKALTAAGIAAELVKGNGYFYFAGDAVAFASTTSVYTCHLTDNTVAEWVDMCREFADESTARAPGEVPDVVTLRTTY